MYTEKYDLHHRPFENTPDPQFLFLSDLHREVLSSLEYCIESSKGFILVSGDIGTGKTTLIHALLRKIKSSNIILHIINPRTDFNEIISNLAKKLSINSKGQDRLELIDSMRDKLNQLDCEGKRTIIIIDEAHFLSEKSLEDIRLLSNIETEKRKLIQIILVGQNEIHKVLNKDSQAPLKQRIVLNRNLVPFNKKDCFEYIRHRLKVAGAQSSIFHKKALIKIWAKSAGVPRLINQICDNALLIGFALDKDMIGLKIIKEVIRDMEIGDIKEAFPPPNTRSNKFAWLCTIIIIVLFTAFFVIKPQIPNMIFKPFASTNDPSEKLIQSFESKKRNAPDTKIREFLIKGKGKITGEKIKNITEIEKVPKTAPEIKEEKIIVSENRIKLEPKPIANFNHGTANLQNNPLSRRTEIKPHEYMFNIAKKEYGIANDMIIDMIHMANPEIKNVNKIFPGKKLILPFIEKKDLIVQNSDGNFHIHYASFYNYTDTKDTVQKLSKDNEMVFYVPVKQGENLVYRVYFGFFNKKEEAVEHINNIQIEYLSFL